MNRAEERMRQELGERWAGVTVRAVSETDSTNLRLKIAARTGEIAPPYLLTADGQIAGRGRLGRTFISPPGTGLYMSLLFAPPTDADSGRITMLAAVAVCRAIEELTGKTPKIKWVNDLFWGGKKICGILAERIEQGVIVGVGVNLKAPPGGFPEAAGPAGALDAEVDRFVLAGRITRHFLDGTTDLNASAIADNYRKRMPLIGKTVRYTRNGEEKNALITGVADDGGLMIRDETGPRVLRTGEVSLGSGAVAELF